MEKARNICAGSGGRGEAQQPCQLGRPDASSFQCGCCIGTFRSPLARFPVCFSLYKLVCVSNLSSSEPASVTYGLSDRRKSLPLTTSIDTQKQHTRTHTHTHTHTHTPESPTCPVCIIGLSLRMFRRCFTLSLIASHNPTVIQS